MEAQTIQELFEWFVTKVWDWYGPLVGVLAALFGTALVLGSAYLILRLVL
jgi:hypothetical protein